MRNLLWTQGPNPRCTVGDHNAPAVTSFDEPSEYLPWLCTCAVSPGVTVAGPLTLIPNSVTCEVDGDVGEPFPPSQARPHHQQERSQT